MEWIMITWSIIAFIAVGTFLIWAMVHADVLLRGEEKLRARMRQKRARRAADALVRQGYIVVLHENRPERDRTVTWAVEDFYDGQS